MRKHYVVLAHRSPDQLARLIYRLDDGASRFWVHLDARQDATAYDVLRRSHVHLVRPRESASWGSWSLTKAILAGIRAAVGSHDPGHVVLLSGQDYPIRSNEQIDAELAQRPLAIWMDAGPIEQTWPEQFREKTDYYSLPVSHERGDLRLFSSLSGLGVRERAGWVRRIVRVHGLRQGMHHVRAMWSPRAAPPMPLYGGSAWMALPWQAAVQALDVLDANPALVAYLEHTQCSDEIAVATALMNHPAIGEWELFHGPHFIDWSRFVEGSPAVLTGEDVAHLLALPSHYLFARKFDLEQHPGALDALDAHLARHS